MTDTVNVNLSRLSVHERGVIQRFIELKSLMAAAQAFNIPIATAMRYAQRAGLGKATRAAIESGAPVTLAGEESSAAEPVRLDVMERHRLNSAIDALKSGMRDLKNRLAAAEDHRASILRLTADPIEPVFDPPATADGVTRGRQAVVLHLSDLHVGEVVHPDEVMGVNSYDLDIARKRIGRLFDVAASLTTTAWPRSDSAPRRIHVLLGGDLISGQGLHPELAETDAVTAYEQTKLAAQYISGGILGLYLAVKDHFEEDVELHVISVPGNHGRSTIGKPRAKLAALQSYDTLVADFIESALREFTTVKHFRPRAFDAYFDVVGWPCLLTHGDRMSAGGGTGFIGPMANIIKGHRKVVDTEYRQRRPVRYVFNGHYHTSGVTPFGFSNGSGVGYGEFAKSIRADPEPAQQNYMVFHERHGLIRYQPIALGTPDEGTIYEPRGGLILPQEAA
jgi:hypothetical protein